MAPSLELENMRKTMNQQMVFDCLELGTLALYLLIIMFIWVAILRIVKMRNLREQRRTPAVIHVIEDNMATPTVKFEVNVNVNGEEKGVKRIITRKIVDAKRSKLTGDSTVYNNLKAL